MAQHAVAYKEHAQYRKWKAAQLSNHCPRSLGQNIVIDLANLIYIRHTSRSDLVQEIEKLYRVDYPRHRQTTRYSTRPACLELRLSFHAQSYGCQQTIYPAACRS